MSFYMTRIPIIWKSGTTGGEISWEITPFVVVRDEIRETIISREEVTSAEELFKLSTLILEILSGEANHLVGEKDLERVILSDKGERATLHAVKQTLTKQGCKLFEKTLKGCTRESHMNSTTWPFVTHQSETKK